MCFGNRNSKIPGKSHESRYERIINMFPILYLMSALMHRWKIVSVSVDQIFVKKGDNESGKYTSKKCVLQLLLHLLQIRIRRGSRCLVRLFYYYTNIFYRIWNSFSKQICCDVMPLSLFIKSWEDHQNVFAKLNVNVDHLAQNAQIQVYIKYWQKCLGFVLITRQDVEKLL